MYLSEYQVAENSNKPKYWTSIQYLLSTTEQIKLKCWMPVWLSVKSDAIPSLSPHSCWLFRLQNLLWQGRSERQVFWRCQEGLQSHWPGRKWLHWGGRAEVGTLSYYNIWTQASLESLIVHGSSFLGLIQNDVPQRAEEKTEQMHTQINKLRAFYSEITN